MIGFNHLKIGLDMGTANTLLYVQGRGVSINEPSLVTVRASTGEIHSTGGEAEAGLGRTPQKFRVVRPIRRGMISDLRLCEGMLQRFMAKAQAAGSLRRLQVAVAIPNGLTEVERLAIVESLRNAGAAIVLLVEKSLAAARGAGLPIEEPHGRMVVDIGAGVTEIAVISLGNIVHARTIPIGGDEMDLAIVEFVREKHQLLIGERTAEQLKVRIGTARPGSEALSMNVKGRCLIHGIPRETAVSDCEIRGALARTTKRIATAIREALDQIPPELSADLIENGIVLTGGAALLKNMDRLVSEECGLQVRVSHDPLSAVILGLAHQLSVLRRSDWRRFGHVS